MKAFLMLPLMTLLCIGCQKTGCSMDTTFICIALVVCGYMANSD